MQHSAVAHHDASGDEVVLDFIAAAIVLRRKAPPPGGAEPNNHGVPKGLRSVAMLSVWSRSLVEVGRKSPLAFVQSELFHNTSTVHRARSMLVLLMLVNRSWSCCVNCGRVSPRVHVILISLQGCPGRCWKPTLKGFDLSLFWL